MANLEGMPIGSLPELTGDLQDEDEVVVYRPSTGKAYQANTDLIDSFSDSKVGMYSTGYIYSITVTVTLPAIILITYSTTYSFVIFRSVNSYVCDDSGLVIETNNRTITISRSTSGSFIAAVYAVGDIVVG